MFLKNVATVIRQPEIGLSFAGWIFQKHVLGKSPTKLVRGKMLIGEFCSFSEFNYVDHFLNDAEFHFFQTYDFGEGDIVDVGANIGLISLLFAARFPDRSVHAIEASPSTFPALTANIARNAAGNVRAHKTAISDQSGFVMFNADPMSRGTASICAQKSANQQKVESLTLDDFVAANGITRIAFLKVDIEGYETLMFRGGAETFRKVQPRVVYFEVCPGITTAAGFDAAAPAQILLEHNYKLYRLLGSGELSPAALSDLASITYENWIAVAP